MQVFAFLVGLDEARVSGEMRHDTHLNLRVVRSHEFIKAIAHDEGRTNLTAGFGAHGDVLQVGFGGRQTAGRGHGLVKRGVNAAVRLHGFDEALQGGLHLLVLAVCQEVIQEGMRVLCRELFNLLGRGGIARLRLFGLGQLESLKEHGLQLLRRVEVELVIAGKLAGGALLFGNLLYKGILLRFENVNVNGDSGSLHARQDGYQRQLEVGIELERVNLL